jgi:tripartite-type tricarboxylate transporter receptor subunit TctC
MSVIRSRWSVARLLCSLTLTAALAYAGGKAEAKDPAAFYKGQSVTVIVGYTPGGGYDQTARILSRHMGKHIPGNPAMIVRNMPGAGTVVAANHVNNAAPKDGTVIGLYADLLPLAPLLGVKEARFDPRKFGWLGSMAARGTPVLMVRADAPATNVEDMRKKEVLIGASGPDASTSYALLLNDLFGFNLKILSGYRGGTAEIELAIERGEAHGRASMDWSRLRTMRIYQKKEVLVVIQLALESDPDLVGVPTAYELAKNDEDRWILEMVLGTNRFFRAFSTAAGVPDYRLAALRAAFAATRDDPEFQAEFNKAYEPGITFSSPEMIQAFIERSYSLPPAIIARAAKFMGSL